MNDWYYKTVRGEGGPITRDEMASLCRAGDISPKDLVRMGRVGSWTHPGEALFDAQMLIAAGIDPKPEPVPSSVESDIYVLSQSGPIGPLTVEKVRQLMVDGKVPTNAFVRFGNDGVWRLPAEGWHDATKRAAHFSIPFWTTAKDVARQATEVQEARPVSRTILRFLLTIGIFLLLVAGVVLVKAVGKWLTSGQP